MAQKDNAPTLSFFSFQDVITTVTGIMFLVVLLLLLLIFESKVKTAPDPNIVETTRIREAVELLRHQLNDAQAWIAENEARADRLLALPPYELPERLKALQTVLEIEKERFLALQRSVSEQREAQRCLREDSRKISAEIPALESQVTLLELDIPPLDSQLAILKAEMARQKKQIDISVEREESKSPILVECRLEGIRVKEMGQEPIDFSVKNDSEGKMSSVRFLKWAAGRNARMEYFVFLVKPSGFPMISRLMYEVQKLGYERGAEVIPDNDAEVL